MKDHPLLLICLTIVGLTAVFTLWFSLFMMSELRNCLNMVC